MFTTPCVAICAGACGAAPASAGGVGPEREGRPGGHHTGAGAADCSVQGGQACCGAALGVGVVQCSGVGWGWCWAPGCLAMHWHLPCLRHCSRTTARFPHPAPCTQRDTRMAKLLLNWDADGHLPFLLDIVPPQAGSLFATKASTAHADPPACLPFERACSLLLWLASRLHACPT